MEPMIKIATDVEIGEEFKGAPIVCINLSIMSSPTDSLSTIEKCEGCSDDIWASPVTIALKIKGHSLFCAFCAKVLMECEEEN